MPIGDDNMHYDPHYHDYHDPHGGIVPNKYDHGAMMMPSSHSMMAPSRMGGLAGPNSYAAPKSNYSMIMASSHIVAPSRMGGCAPPPGHHHDPLYGIDDQYNPYNARSVWQNGHSRRDSWENYIPDSSKLRNNPSLRLRELERQAREREAERCMLAQTMNRTLRDAPPYVGPNGRPIVAKRKSETAFSDATAILMDNRTITPNDVEYPRETNGAAGNKVDWLD